MDCTNLIPFIDGELSVDDAYDFRAHLVTCEACRVGLVEELQLTARLSDMGTVDRKAVEARIAELRADDAAMTRAPWIMWDAAEDGEVYDDADVKRVCQVSRHPVAANTAGIARTRNSLASTAGLLEGLLREVERLRQPGVLPTGAGWWLNNRHSQTCIVGECAACDVAVFRAEVARLTAERDEALADGVLSQRVCDTENDRAQLRAEVAAMQLVVDASVALRRSDAGEGSTPIVSILDADTIADVTSLADAERIAAENERRSHAALTRWRNVVDAYRASKEPT
jgi:hypothetical protein